jgi:hypothetical protein
MTATIAAGEPGVTEIELLRPGAGQAGLARVTCTVMPVWASCHTSRSGSATSRNTERVA